MASGVVLLALVNPVGHVVAASQPRHEDGKVELYVSDFHVHPDGDAQRVHAILVDRDSGTPAPGFEVTMTATARGTTVGPIELTSDDEGNYTARVELDRGTWTVTIDARQGGSATPAKATTQTFTIVVDDGEGDAGGGTTWRAVLLAGAGVAAVVAVAFVLRRRSRIAT
jgi:hypothetical protein